MHPDESQRQIDEICMEWLDTSEDTVSAPMRFRIKQIIGEQKLQNRELQEKVRILEEANDEETKIADNANRLISEYRKLLWWLVRDMGPMVQIDKKDLATIPPDAELMSWDEPMYDAVMLKATLKSVGEAAPGVTIVKATERPNDETKCNAEGCATCRKCGHHYRFADHGSCPFCKEKESQKRKCEPGEIHNAEPGKDVCYKCGANRAHWNSQ